MFISANRLFSLVVFFAGLMHWLVGAAHECTWQSDWIATRASLDPVDSFVINCTNRASFYDVAERVSMLEDLRDPSIAQCSRAILSQGLVDYVYFSMITFSTVGYGDFVPPDSLTRIVSIIMMLVLMSYVPLEVSHLVEMAQRTAEYCMGTLPASWQDYVMIFGPIPPNQLEAFVQEFCRMRGTVEANTRFIVLSPLELNLYRATLSDGTRSRTYLQRGDLLSDSSALPKPVHSAKAIFVFSNTEVSDKLLEDGQSLVRCLVLRKKLADKCMKRISVQLNRGREKTLALNLGVNATIALDEVHTSCLVCCSRMSILGL